VQERDQYQESLDAEAQRSFLHFLDEIAQNHYGVMRDAVDKLAMADCLFSLALVSLQGNYVRPEFTDEDVLEIDEGRHPMVEALSSDPFVPVSVKIGAEEPRSKVITGPNMGGKSSAVRMIALIAIMAQIGSYVPARVVRLGMQDAILTRMGGEWYCLDRARFYRTFIGAASDDLARGRSTFMIEMSETSDILHTATARSLVLLDELGRGTSTFDGVCTLYRPICTFSLTKFFSYTDGYSARCIRSSRFVCQVQDALHHPLPTGGRCVGEETPDRPTEPAYGLQRGLSD
jgi:DNA mismatch repair protein MSH3